MNTTIFIIVAFILSSICILNLVIQFSEKLMNNVLKYDYFQLFTYWTLFAPKPMKYDFYIIYRDQLKSGESNDFCEIEIIFCQRIQKFYGRNRIFLFDFLSVLLINQQKFFFLSRKKCGK